MVAILSWARSSAAPESLTLVEMPATLSFTELIALAAVYCALRTSFWVRMPGRQPVNVNSGFLLVVAGRR